MALLGLLVFLQGWTRTLGIELKLMNQMNQVQELLERTNLDSVFDICSSEDVASLLGHINFRNNTNSEIYDSYRRQPRPLSARARRRSVTNP